MDASQNSQIPNPKTQKPKPKNPKLQILEVWNTPPHPSSIFFFFWSGIPNIFLENNEDEEKNHILLFCLLLLLIGSFNKCRKRHRLTRSATPSPDRSPWSKLFHRGDDSSFLELKLREIFLSMSNPYYFQLNQLLEEEEDQHYWIHLVNLDYFYFPK